MKTNLSAAAVLILACGLFATTVSAGGDDAPMARYARVTLLGEGVYLHLAEVQVFSEGKNVALRGKASQVSTDFGGLARRASDGNRNGRYDDARSTSHTGLANNPWWEVDLGRPMPIQRVVVWNRTDTPAVRDRLNHYKVELFDAQRKRVWQAERRKPPSPSATFATDVDPRLIDRAAPRDTTKQGVYVLDEPIPASGWLTDFSFFDNDKTKTPGFVTPLVLRPVGSQWQVVAIGEACRSNASGVQRFAFWTPAGRCPRVKAGDRFGWRDGELGFDSPGAIDFDPKAGESDVIYLGNDKPSFRVGQQFEEVRRVKRVYSVAPHVVREGEPQRYRERLTSVWFSRYEHLRKAAAHDGRAQAELDDIKSNAVLMKLIHRPIDERLAATLLDNMVVHMRTGLLDDAHTSLKAILQRYPLTRAADDARALQPELMDRIRRKQEEKEARVLLDQVERYSKLGLKFEVLNTLKQILSNYPATRAAQDAYRLYRPEIESLKDK